MNNKKQSQKTNETRSGDVQYYKFPKDDPKNLNLRQISPPELNPTLNDSSPERGRIDSELPNRSSFNLDSEKKNPNFRKISIGAQTDFGTYNRNYHHNMTTMFLQDDLFLGEFEFADGVFVNRSYQSHKEINRIYYTSVSSNTPQLANILIIHGWIAVGCMETAVKFARLGIKAHVFHLSGFGYSGGKRANCSIKHHVKDIILVLKECSKNYPLFIYGHSLGGLITIIFSILNNEQNITGVILSCPDITIQKRSSKFLDYVTEIALELAPYLEDSLFNFKRDKNMMINDVKDIQSLPSAMSPDLLGGRFSYQYYKSKQFVQMNLQKFKAPVLVLHDDKSKLNSVEDVEKFLNEIGSTDKTLKVIRQKSNGVYKEDASCVMQAILIDWVLKRCGVKNFELKFDELQSNIALKRFRKRKLIIVLMLYMIGLIYQRSKYRTNTQKWIIYPIYFVITSSKFLTRQVAYNIMYFWNSYKQEILF